MHKLGLRTLVYRSVGTLVRQLGSGILQLLTIIVIARELGPEGNGQFAIALLLPLMLATFLNMGMPTAHAHFVGSRKVSVRVAFDTSLRWSTFLSPVGLFLGAIILWFKGTQWFPGVPTHALWLALTIYPITLIQHFFSSIFQGLQDFKSYNLILLLQPAVTLLLTLASIAMGMGDVMIFVAIHWIGAGITLFISYILLCTNFNEMTFKYQSVRSYSRRIRKYALKAHLAIALAFVNYRVDVYLLNLLGDTAGTGQYVIATQIVERLWILSTAVGVVLFPYLSKLSSEAGSEAEKRSILTPLMYLGVMLLTSLAAIFTGFIATPLINTLFGNGYEQSALIMQLLLPGIVAWSGARVLAHDIVARGRPELNVYMNTGVLFINVIGNILLIPKYGTQGAAIATTIAYCLFSILMLIFYSKLAQTNWKSAFINTFELSKNQLRF